jgi:hypothetical protein
MKKAILTMIIGVVVFSSVSFSQVLFQQDFNTFTAGTIIGQSGWTQGSGSQFLTIASATPLVYSGVSTSKGGNYATMPVFSATARVFKTFTPKGVIATGDVYYFSFLINLTATTASSANYCLALGDNAGTSSNLVPKLFARNSGTGTFNFGISKQTTTYAAITYGTTNFNLNQTYFVVIKYMVHNLGGAVTGAPSLPAAYDDECYLWVNPSISSGLEPVTSAAECQKYVTGVVAADSLDKDIDFYQTPAGGIGSITWNSRGAGNPVGGLDCLRFAWGTSSASAWSYLLSVLPVELTSFSASVANSAVNLRWSTATEVNNTGFEIERSTDNSGWTKIGFIAGNGNSNSTKAYSFTDNTVSKSGNYYYRLKQIDVNGSYKYYNTSEVNFTAPLVFALNQNYPNPFNPSTVIAYSIPNASNVKLSVYNAIGQVVNVLENGFKSAGNYTVNFNASNLPSGLYFYKIEAGQFSQTRKMMLVK